MDIISSFQRIGQHLDESIFIYLTEKQEVEWPDCNFYNCCNSATCKEGSIVSKNHYFDLQLPIDNDLKKLK
jgi:hypothetical protein